MATTALLILGAARSGTTLLGNLLAAHSGVASISHPLHWGQKENNAATLARCYPDLSKDDDYIRFVELFGSSDFFVASDLDRQRFYERREAHVFDILASTMEGLCEKRSCNHWVTKFDVLLISYPELARRFVETLQARGHQIRWLYIERDVLPMLESYLNMEGESSKWQLGYTASRAGILLQLARRAQIRQFADLQQRLGGQVLRLDYQQLVENRAAAISAMLEFCSLPPIANLDTSLPRNTSPKRTAVPFRPFELKWIGPMDRLTYGASRLGLVSRLVRLREQRRSAPAPLSWRILKTRYFRERFVQQLIGTGQTELAKIVQRHKSNLR